MTDLRSNASASTSEPGMTHSLRYLANCSLLFTERPLLDRPAAARAAGFDAVEFWWPFAEAVPGDAEVDRFVAAVADSGVQLVGLNFYGGDLGGPDAGIVSIPSRAAQFRDSADVAVGIGARLGVRAFNALYGVRIEDGNPQQQDEVALENLVWAARAVGEIGAEVLVEAVSGPKPYPLRTAAQAVGVVDRVRAAGPQSIGFLCDLYHLAENGDDISTAIATHVRKISHVQIADSPGRGEPGSGALELDRYLAELQAHGYTGWVSLEYRPTSNTEASLGWLPRQRPNTAERTNG